MTDSITQAALTTATGFDDIIDGKQTYLYILRNKNGVEAAITNYGGHLVSLLVPDNTGKLINVVPGFGDIESYKQSLSFYYGGIIGRFANRIANGRFELDGKCYN